MQVDWGACSTANDAEQRLERQCKRLSRPNSDWKLHLSHAQLDYIPRKVLSSNFASLLRLDLSFNRIKEIPSGIGLLLSLTELWIAHNPLETISPAIKGCLNLESLDISFTRVAEVPSEISFLKNLRTFDWRGTPFAENMSSLLSSSSSLLLPSKASTVFGLKEFKLTVGEVYKREELIRDLKGKLSVGHYAQDIVLIDYDNLVEELIQVRYIDTVYTLYL